MDKTQQLMVFAIDDNLRFPNPRDTDAEDEDGI